MRKLSQDQHLQFELSTNGPTAPPINVIDIDTDIEQLFVCILQLKQDKSHINEYSLSLVQVQYTYKYIYHVATVTHSFSNICS